MNNKNQLYFLQPTLNGAKVGHLKVPLVTQDQVEKDKKKEEQTEIIRRLKIQNKKLLEQVVLLKKRIKKNSGEKAKLTKRLSYLKKISNSFSVVLGTCQ